MDNNLYITVSIIDDYDYDGNAVQIKESRGKIGVAEEGAVPVSYVQSCPSDTPTPLCISGFETAISGMGYTWGDVIVQSGIEQ